MSGLQLTKEKITELPEKSHKCFFQRYHEELRQEQLESYRAKLKKGQEQTNRFVIIFFVAK
ncbi:MAG: hypothetical protein LBE12_15790 [Planctomycetaceae bacterium]|nr:hypothetical protein [Planctomycetaceae bacterium]